MGFAKLLFQFVGYEIVSSTVRQSFTKMSSKIIEYEIIGEGSQICRYCLRRKGHKSQLLAGEGSQILLF